jgi:uncharacterized protein (DUF58 family)
MIYLLLIVACCLLPILIVGGIGVYIIFKSRSGTFRVKDIYTRINNWVGIITNRGILAIIIATITLLVSFTSEELSIISSYAIFLYILVLIPVTVAFFMKIYSSFSDKINRKSRLVDTQLSRREIKEGEEAKISIKINLRIPIGYFLKVKAKAPQKLGGEVKSVVTKSQGKTTEVEFTIPETHRGEYEIGPIELTFQDILGFSNIKILDASRFDLKITTDIPRIKNYNIKYSYKEGVREESDLTARINNDDYFTARPYVRGDYIKHIHWKLTAKKNEIMVRQPETSTVTYSKISLLILNTYPTLNSRSLMLPSRYKVAAEKALDKQVQIAAAIADFAIRKHLEIEIHYLKGNKEFATIVPTLDDNYQWLSRLAEIKMASPFRDLSKIHSLFNDKKAFLVTTSELIPDNLIETLSPLNNNEKTSEILYVPLTDEIKENLTKPNRRNIMIRILKKLLLTKGYYSQTNLREKFKNLLKRKEQRYQKQDLKKIKTLESRCLTALTAEGFQIKDFTEDIYGSKFDNIIKVLENG